MKLKVKEADPSESPTAFELFKKTALWLHKKEINYWQHWINPDEKWTNWVNKGFEEGQFYFVYHKSEIIGIFRLLWCDELFWGDRDYNSGYIHSITIDPEFHGQGLGAKIIFMIEEICRAEEKKFLRLDCGIKSKKLHKYFEKHGFLRAGEVTVLDKTSLLFEKEL